MMIIRPIAKQDLSALQAIARESGPGFTSLVDDAEFLERKIERSLASFRRPVASPGDEGYLFVLESPDTGEIMGVTGIEAAVGIKRPLYHFRQSQLTQRSARLGLARESQVLSLCSHYTGCSEICTLFLRPRFRRPWAGKLLSRVRFLFMAQHQQRFAETVIAEMRGVSCPEGRAPFWEWLREHFVDMDFATVTAMVGAGDSDFIKELMPPYPLYVNLLSPQARQVIGKVHDQTAPALRLLEQEGFGHHGYVDPFDAGPTVEARLTEISSVAKSVACEIQITDSPTPRADHGATGSESPFLAVANSSVEDFRASVTQQASYLAHENLLQIPSALAQSLALRNGGSARFLNLSAEPATALPRTAVPHCYQEEARYAYR
ncbi:arginine N-succinyltransferase [Marinobacter salicampi]|uniref:arginine N-succinyltransferase n=1 Tax=Marinobacter salicampi TaxID=435907 RepID=UPI001409C227|nr:arginine N-succinyltransferase [Marinobacter salicampi]